MIRITAGGLRGRMIKCPKGKAVRPTTSRVRESLFNMIGPAVVGSRWIDGFAGCGVMGFEALSRGAASVLAIEKNTTHAHIIEANRDGLGLSSAQHQVVCIEIEAWLNRLTKVGQWAQEPVDFIFLDPPFPMTQMGPWIEQACQLPGLLAPQTGVIIWEHRDKTVQLPPSVEIVDQRHYSTSSVTWIKPQHVS